MAKIKTVVRQVERPWGENDFDAQSWPINCALLVLAGFTTGTVIATCDFETTDPVRNGWVRLGLLTLLLGALAVGMLYLQRQKSRRRMQLAVLLSMLVHLWLALGLSQGHLFMADVPVSQTEWVNETRLVTLPDYGREPTNQPTEDEFEKPVPTDVAVEQQAKESQRFANAEQTAAQAEPGTGDPSANPSSEAAATPSPPSPRRMIESAPRSSESLSGVRVSRRTDTGQEMPSEAVEMPSPTVTAAANAVTEANVAAKRTTTTTPVEQAQAAAEAPTAAPQVARTRPTRPADPTAPAETTAAAPQRTARQATTEQESVPTESMAAARTEATPAQNLEPAATTTPRSQAASGVASASTQAPSEAGAATAAATAPRRTPTPAPEATQTASNRPERSDRPVQDPTTKAEAPAVAAVTRRQSDSVEPSQVSSSQRTEASMSASGAAASATENSPAAARAEVAATRRTNEAADPTAVAQASDPSARTAVAQTPQVEAVEGPTVTSPAGNGSPAAEPQPAQVASSGRRARGSAEAASSDAAAASVPGGAQLARRAPSTRSSNAPAPEAGQVAGTTPGRSAQGATSDGSAERPEAVAAAGGDGPSRSLEASSTSTAGRVSDASTPSAATGVASDSPAVAANAQAGGRAATGRAAGMREAASNGEVASSSPSRSIRPGEALAGTPAETPSASTPAPDVGGPGQPQPNAEATASRQGGSPNTETTAAGLAQAAPDSTPGGASPVTAANLRRTTGSADPTAEPKTAPGGQVARASRDATAAAPDAGQAQTIEIAAGAASGEPGLNPAAQAGGRRSNAATGLVDGMASAEAPLGAAQQAPATGGRRGKTGQADGAEPSLEPGQVAAVGRAARPSVEQAGLAAEGESVTEAAGGAPLVKVESGAGPAERRGQSSGANAASAENVAQGQSGSPGATAVAAAGQRRGAGRANEANQALAAATPQPGRAADAAAPGAAAKVGDLALAGPAGGKTETTDASQSASSGRGEGTAAGAVAQGTTEDSQRPGVGAVAAAGRGAGQRKDDESELMAKATGGGTIGRRAAAASEDGLSPERVETGAVAVGGQGSGEAIDAPQLTTGRPRSASTGNLLADGDPTDTASGPTGPAAGLARAGRRVGGAEQGPEVAMSATGPVGRAAAGESAGAVATVDDLGPVTAAEAGEVALATNAGPNAAAIGRQAPALTVEIQADEGPGGLGTDADVRLGVPNRRARSQSEVVQVASGKFILKRSAGQLSIDTRADPAPAFRGRMPEERKQAARSRGGTQGTEEAVEIGLDFLARHQSPDGRWKLDAFAAGKSGPEYEGDLGSGSMQSDTAATGMALLCFLGAGYTHRDGKHREVVESGLAFLVANQKPNGDLFTGGSKYCWLYSHGIAAIALCEAYGMTRDPVLKDAAQRALDFIAASQSPSAGGWRYDPQVSTDTSVSGWQMMALKSGELAGLEIPSSCYPLMGKWLDTAQGPRGTPSKYAYRPASEHRHQREPSKAMTAEALLMRLYLGWQRNNPHVLEGADYLQENLPSIGTKSEPQRDCYYWYYATQVMFQVGGDHWTAWNESLRTILLNTQTKEGGLAGSWNPKGEIQDRWGAEGGRLYVTAMHLLMLEVYYRHLPLYQNLAEEPASATP